MSAFSALLAATCLMALAFASYSGSGSYSGSYDSASSEGHHKPPHVYPTTSTTEPPHDYTTEPPHVYPPPVTGYPIPRFPAVVRETLGHASFMPFDPHPSTPYQPHYDSHAAPQYDAQPVPNYDAYTGSLPAAPVPFSPYLNAPAGDAADPVPAPGYEYSSDLCGEGVSDCASRILDSGKLDIDIASLSTGLEYQWRFSLTDIAHIVEHETYGTVDRTMASHSGHPWFPGYRPRFYHDQGNVPDDEAAMPDNYIPCRGINCELDNMAMQLSRLQEQLARYHEGSGSGSEYEPRLVTDALRRRLRVLAEDTRVEVLNPSQATQYIGSITYANRPDAPMCTGVLIGPRHVLTAGSCVHSGPQAYDHYAGTQNAGHWYDPQWFFPGLTRNNQNVKGFRVADRMAFQGWSRHGDPDWDIAVLVLTHDTGLGWMQMTSERASVLTHYFTAGYHADKAPTSMYESYGYPTSVRQFRADFDTLDTVKSFGAPLFSFPGPHSDGMHHSYPGGPGDEASAYSGSTYPSPMQPSVDAAVSGVFQGADSMIYPSYTEYSNRGAMLGLLRQSVICDFIAMHSPGLHLCASLGPVMQSPDLP